MSTIESISTLPHQFPLPPRVQDRYEQVRHLPDRVRHLPDRVRASYRDRAAAFSRTIGSLSLIGPVEYADQVLLPETADSALRTHQRAIINRNGHRHALLITQPLSGKSTSGNLIFHGITQDPTKGGAALLHSRLAAALPEDRTVSVHSDGVGELETQLSPRQAATRSFRRMARARGEIGKVIFNNVPVHTIALSMGTVHAVNMAHQNLAEQFVNLRRLSLLSPAIVTPDKARYVMGRKFLPSVFDEQRTGSNSSISRTISACREIRTLPVACISNALYLTRGTEASLLMDVAAGYNMNISYGHDDPLAQPELYEAAAAAYPDNVRLFARPGGHSIIPRIEDIVADITSDSERQYVDSQSYSMR